MSSGEDARRGRGRPRTPGAEEKILAAALDEYGERGWAGFTMDAVARRAGVGKSTVYLRWQDKEALLTDAVTNRGMELAVVDTGSFEGDLRQLAVNILRHFHTADGWAALRITFDCASSPERLGLFSAAMAEVHGRRIEEICQRATERGEMLEDFPPGAVTEALYGAAVINSLSERLEGRTDDDATLETRAAHVVAMVLTGVASEQARSTPKGSDVSATWTRDDVDYLALLDRLRHATPANTDDTMSQRRLRWVAHSLPDVASVVPSGSGDGWPAYLSAREVARLVAERTEVWAEQVERVDGLHLAAPHVLAEAAPAPGTRAAPGEVLPRRLYVLERGEGRVRALRRGLLRHLEDVQRSLVLEHIDETRAVLRSHTHDDAPPIARWRLGKEGPYDAWVARVLVEQGVEAVHVLRHDDGVVAVAGLLGLPVVETPDGLPSEGDRHPLTIANGYRNHYQPPTPPLLGIITPSPADRVLPTSHVRALRRALNAAESGLLHVERVVGADYARGLTERFDTLLLVRNALQGEESRRVLDRAYTDGTRVVLDLDDDLVTDHAVARLTAQGWDPDQLATLRRVAAVVDTVIVSTPALAAVLADLNPHVSCLPNELDPRLWTRHVETVAPPADDEIRVLYMGTTTHEQDLALLTGVAAALSERLGRAVVLEIVGVSKGEPAPGVRRLRPERTDYPGFVTWLREQAPRWSVGVAPLADTEFNRCKSDLKLLEYAMLGLPSVASDVGPYAGSALARLSDNSTEAWVEALAETIESGSPATATVLAERMLDERTVAAWVETVLGQPR